MPAGTLEYRERGTGPVLVFVHGAAVNGDLWRKVVPALAAAHRCIALDVPLGGHSIALDGEPDLSLFGVAAIVADFLEALDLTEVTIVGNDTGVLRAADPRDTVRAAELLTTFDKPALVAWAAEDKFFPIEHGRRLAELLPQGRLKLVERSRTFIPEDNPSALAALKDAALRPPPQDPSRR